MKDGFYRFAMKKKAPFGYACHKIICDENGNPCDYGAEEKEHLEELKNSTEAIEETGVLYKGITEEKDVWERRLNAIADVLKLENDYQFQRIIENLPFSLNITSMDGLLLYANPKSLELFEIDAEAIGIKTVLGCWTDVKKRDLWIKALKKKGIANDFEMHLRTTSGKEFWAIGSGIIIQYQNQSCILSTQLDISERKRIEAALKSSEEKYRLLTEFTSDVIWILNLKKNKYTYISPSIYYLTGQTVEEAIKENLAGSLTAESLVFFREEIERGLQEFIQNPEQQKAYIIELRQKCKNGDVIWVEVSLKYRTNDAGEIEIVGASRNIEERKRAEREVLYLSYHDQLTGLYNRRFYEEELHRMNFLRNLPFTLVLADINGLKLTNDAFGHFAGDNLLKKFASILERELRAEDAAARIGGDEFALLLPKTDSMGARKLIDRINESIRHVKIDHAILSASFGWATKQEVTDDFTTLFMQAEDQMYHTKLVESANMKSRTIRLAMEKLYEKNESEQEHSETVGTLCKEIGNAMELTPNALRDLELLGQMHDIGKIGIQAEILNKAEKLTDGEWLEIKRHPEIGYQMLRSADEYVHIAEFVLSHHERMDGKGYPRNLKAHEIPLPARILSIAEAYAFMRSAHQFNSSLSESDAVRELLSNSGKQFDGEIVKIFIEDVLKKKMR